MVSLKADSAALKIHEEISKQEGSTHQSSLKKFLIGIISFAVGFDVLQGIRKAEGWHPTDRRWMLPSEGCFLNTDPPPAFDSSLWV